MARHIMAVCVVCLLCADRLPCQQHVGGVFPPQEIDGSVEHHKLNAIVYRNGDIPKSGLRSRSTETYDINNSGRRRRKRHADHGTGEAVYRRPEITKTFLDKIFDEYGKGDGTIHINDFQRMLQQLGLHQLLQQDYSLKGKMTDNNTCIADKKLVHYIKPHDSYHHHHEHHEHNSHHYCGDNSTLCSQLHIHEDAHEKEDEQLEDLNYTLSTQDVVNVCPVLLYQLASPNEEKKLGCISDGILAAIDTYEAERYKSHKEDIIYVWIYAFISVFACSILGLVGVAIIPFMDSRYYKHIIQFLVSLAVGTMTGDALLHLLPHSLAGQTESNMIFKGLTCMCGIIFFYVTEHGLTMISEWRKSIEKKEASKPSRAKVMRDPDSSINNSVAGDKMCKSKYSSYPYCYDEIAMDTKNDVWLHLPNNPVESSAHTRNGKVDSESVETAAQSLLSTSQNNYAPIAETNHHHHHHHEHRQQAQQQLSDSNTLTDLDGNVVADGIGVSVPATVNGKDISLMNDTVTVILREHESSHHGHSHKHGHVHSPPESLSAVAWMIIMGDGLHNFTDGMAIGAAFAENIAGGFSTSLAVFCHELPHELGDFAILMKAGMSVKSAVYYNLLTGVLSFVGMIFGIVFGQSHETAQWMFAAAAGLFIYIAMVDMMPEISASHKSLEQFALQILGMGSGVLFMLLIAIYEGDLMNVFSSSDTILNGHHH